MDTASIPDDHFDDVSWHDCHVWGISIGAGDPDTGDWTSDLTLDLDFIVEWICGVAEAVLSARQQLSRHERPGTQ